MRVFFLNWFLVIAAVFWFLSSVLILIGYNKTTTFDESYYPGACLVLNVFIIDGNKSAIALLEFKDKHKNLHLIENVTILHDYNWRLSYTYMENYYPVGGMVGCLVSPDGLSIYLEDAGEYFVASLILYLFCAIAIALYAILQYWIYRKRLLYRSLDTRMDPEDLTLYQNTVRIIPDLNMIKHDFSWAQKIMWSCRDRIETEKFKILVEMQMKAIVTYSEGFRSGGDLEKYCRLVYKTVKVLEDPMN